MLFVNHTKKQHLIGNHDIASLTAPKTATAMIEDASAIEDSFDDDANGF